MERLKEEFISEMLRIGFRPEETVRALSALSIALHGYNVSAKDSNIAIYQPIDATDRLIKLFIDCKRVEGCSNGYCTNLGLILPKLFAYAGRGVKEITSFDIRGFLADWKQNNNISGATQDKYRQLINQFFVWLQTEGAVTNNPCASIKKIKSIKKTRESLSQLEMETIRANLTDKRERMLIEFLYSTGCRASELCDVKLTDLDLTEGTVLLFGKGQKQRIGYLNARAVVAIKAYLKDREQQSDYLFCGCRAPYGKVQYHAVENAIKKIDKRVRGLIQHHLHPHLFRHTTATHGLRNGLPVNEVQMLLGHSSIATTMIYADTDIMQVKTDHLKCVV